MSFKYFPFGLVFIGVTYLFFVPLYCFWIFKFRGINPVQSPLVGQRNPHPNLSFIHQILIVSVSCCLPLCLILLYFFDVDNPTFYTVADLVFTYVIAGVLISR